jgi:hypothetical protein
VPAFRTRVFYVPQRPALLTGTPRDFLKTITSFRSRNSGARSAADDLTYPVEVSKAWGIDEELWDRNWSNLSGGESQRIALATAVGLNTAEILLLDGKNVFPLCPSVLTSFLSRANFRPRSSFDQPCGRIYPPRAQVLRKRVEGDSLDHPFGGTSKKSGHQIPSDLSIWL